MSTRVAPLSSERIAQAAEVIDADFRDTPQFVNDSLARRIGVRLITKVETLNPLRSFKGRGTEFLLHTLDPKPDRLVCASAGNFGQGLAFSGGKRGVAVDVFASTAANPLKIERMRNLGANVHLAGADFDDAKDAAREFAETHGIRYIEDGREPAIAEGAGTIALELTRYPERIEAVVVPLGNGALLGGMARWLRDRAPGVEVIGACAAAAPSMELSWRSGEIIETAEAATIADGIAVRVPVPEALDHLRGTVDEVLLVDDARIMSAVRMTFEELGIVVEPAGAAGLAAVLAQPERFAGRLVATPLCGGNLTAAQIREWL
jgi:threonine dehydratase